jgi:hypothetical protein
MRPKRTPPQSYHRRLMDQASSLVNDLPEIAAIVACIATEALIEKFFLEHKPRDLSEPQKDPAVKYVNFNLVNPQVLKKFNRLAKKAVSEEPFWEDFTKLVYIRDKYTHAYLRSVSTQEVKTCLAAAEELHDYVLRLLYGFAMPTRIGNSTH